MCIDPYDKFAYCGTKTGDILEIDLKNYIYKRILPPVANEVITLVKDTSLVYVVGLDDLLKIGKIANNRYASLVPLIFVGVIYLILVAIFTKVFALIEKKFNYYE